MKQKTSTLEPKETFLYSGGVVSRYKTKLKEQNNKCIFITTNALCRIILDNTTFLSRYVISDELLNFPLAPETDKLIKKKMNDRINCASRFAVGSNSSLRQQSHASGKVATNENINNIQICFFSFCLFFIQSAKWSNDVDEFQFDEYLLTTKSQLPNIPEKVFKK